MPRNKSITMKQNYFLLYLLLFFCVAANSQIISQSSTERRLSSVGIEREGRQDSIVTTEVTTITTQLRNSQYVDIVPDSVERFRIEQVPADSADYRGHYVEAYIGGGVSSLNYGLTNDGTVSLMPSAMVQLNYAYFFHRNVGIGIGARFTNYSSMASLAGDRVWNGVTDTDLGSGGVGETYNHNTHINTWRERQTVHTVAVPLTLQFQHHGKSGVGVFAAVGAEAQFGVYNRYNVLEGDIEHTGFYPAWNVTLDMLHEFQQENLSPKGDMQVNPNVGLTAELGMLFELNRQLDLVLSVYGNYAVLDANGSTKQDLGWQNETFTFMQPYEGVWKTTEAGAANPWQAGLKLGLHWRNIDKPKKKTTSYYEHFDREVTRQRNEQVTDTVVTVYVDTIMGVAIAPIETDNTAQADNNKEQQKHQMAHAQAKRALAELNHLYFSFDKAELNDASRERLDAIAQILNDNADLRINIDGHACKTGSSQYNQRLSMRRAKAVADYLKKKGVSEDRMTVRAHGFEIPSSKAEHKLSLDRRVEIKVVE